MTFNMCEQYDKDKVHTVAFNIAVQLQRVLQNQDVSVSYGHQKCPWQDTGYHGWAVLKSHSGRDVCMFLAHWETAQESLSYCYEIGEEVKKQLGSVGMHPTGPAINYN